MLARDGAGCWSWSPPGRPSRRAEPVSVRLSSAPPGSWSRIRKQARSCRSRPPRRMRSVRRQIERRLIGGLDRRHRRASRPRWPPSCAADPGAPAPGRRSCSLDRPASGRRSATTLLAEKRPSSAGMEGRQEIGGAGRGRARSPRQRSEAGGRATIRGGRAGPAPRPSTCPPSSGRPPRPHRRKAVHERLVAAGKTEEAGARGDDAQAPRRPQRPGALSPRTSTPPSTDAAATTVAPGAPLRAIRGASPARPRGDRPATV